VYTGRSDCIIILLILFVISNILSALYVMFRFTVSLIWVISLGVMTKVLPDGMYSVITVMFLMV
jgi:hypothetical protein